MASERKMCSRVDSVLFAWVLGLLLLNFSSSMDGVGEQAEEELVARAADRYAVVTDGGALTAEVCSYLLGQRRPDAAHFRVRTPMPGKIPSCTVRLCGTRLRASVRMDAPPRQPDSVSRDPVVRL